MPPTHQYQVIHAPGAHIQQTLAPLTTQGWRPILMSAATLGVNGMVQVFVMLEKPLALEPTQRIPPSLCTGVGSPGTSVTSIA
jgi:hypothetical protein